MTDSELEICKKCEQEFLQPSPVEEICPYCYYVLGIENAKKRSEVSI